MEKSMSWLNRGTGLIVGLALTVSGANASAATPLPQEVTIRGVEFVLIPAGEFFRHPGVLSGIGPEREMVKVRLEDYYIAKYEARARDLLPFMNEAKPDRHLYAGQNESCSMRIDDKGAYVLVTPWQDLPATHLSWRLADAWARWMGFRLPTEGEWEKAARGNDERTFPWGDQPPDDTYANFGTGSSCLVWPVDHAAKGRSPYGVYNMAGNVREYVADWHDGERDPGRIAFLNYVQDPVNRYPQPTKNTMRLVKGGRWASGFNELKISERLGWADEEEGFQCNGTRFAVDVAVVRDHLLKGTALVTRQ